MFVSSLLVIVLLADPNSRVLISLSIKLRISQVVSIFLLKFSAEEKDC